MSDFHSVLIALTTLAATLAIGSFNPTCAQSSSGFVGRYGSNHWDLWNSNSNGTVNLDYLPAALRITGRQGEFSGPGQTTYTTEAGEKGIVQFHWHFDTTDSQADAFGFLLNDEFVALTRTPGNPRQSGSYRIEVNPGDRFGFAVQSMGDRPNLSTVNITTFSAPQGSPLPESSTDRAGELQLLSVAGLGLILGLATVSGLEACSWRK